MRRNVDNYIQRRTDSVWTSDYGQSSLPTSATVLSTQAHEFRYFLNNYGPHVRLIEEKRPLHDDGLVQHLNEIESPIIVSGIENLPRLIPIHDKLNAWGIAVFGCPINVEDQSQLQNNEKLRSEDCKRIEAEIEVLRQKMHKPLLIVLGPETHFEQIPSVAHISVTRILTRRFQNIAPEELEVQKVRNWTKMHNPWKESDLTRPSIGLDQVPQVMEKLPQPRPLFGKIGRWFQRRGTT